MTAILASIRYNLASLLRFSGRDSRAQFWPWAIFVFLASQFVYLIYFAIHISRFMSLAMTEALRTEQGAKPDPAREHEMVAGFMTSVLNWPLLYIVLGATIALLAAAVVRRLHDVGRSGAWGLMPLPLMLIGVAIAPAWSDYIIHGVARGEAMPPWLAMGFASNMASWIPILILIVWMAQPGSAEPNRYGPPPSA